MLASRTDWEGNYRVVDNVTVRMRPLPLLLTSNFRRRCRRVLVLGVIGVLLAVAVAFFFAEHLLCVRSRMASADAIVVLGGEPAVRVRAAATLFTNGAAPLVLVSGHGDCQENREWLIRYGVVTNSILTECDSTTTQENALYTVRLLRQHGCKRVILVTSWYHSRRALSAFRKYAPDLKFASAPAPRTQVFQYERGYIAAEYLKTIWYALRWHISPFAS